jgi:hypothetical protein
VGGVNMQRPQRSVSGARTNDVCDTRSHAASERIGLEGRLMSKV